jgi:replication factor A1
MIEKMAKELHEQLPNVKVEEIAARLELLLNKYKVPEEEAKRSVLNFFGAKTPAASAQPVKIKDIKTPKQWVTLRAKVLQLWTPNSDTISQVGLLGDDTGTLKFVAWKRAALPMMEEGKSYEFKSIVTDSFQNKFQVNMNKNSAITLLKEEISTRNGTTAVKIEELDEENKWVSLRAKVVQLWEPGSESISQVGLIGDETGTVKFTAWANSNLPKVEGGKCYEFHSVVTERFGDRINIKLTPNTKIAETGENINVRGVVSEINGAIVDILPGSGLIKRCPACNRALMDGLCGEHGEVEGIEDLRIKAVIDDGEVAQDILLNRDAVERLTGMTLDGAKKAAAEAADPGVVMDDIRKSMMGKYYAVSGPVVGRYLLVETINDMDIVDAGAVINEIIQSTS